MAQRKSSKNSTLLRCVACGQRSVLLYYCIFNIATVPSYHIRPGFRKKLETLGKRKDCELVRQWQRSLLNHLYWCVVSTTNGDGDMIKAKWLSLDNHVHNEHSGHNELYPRCSHPPLQGRDRRKKWFRLRKFPHVIILNYY